MSARTAVASCVAVLVLGGWQGVGGASPAAPGAGPGLSQQPRDVRPGQARPASRREAEIVAMLPIEAPAASLYLELAKLQEERGATQAAEATLVKARSVLPLEESVAMALVGFYNRTGQFEQVVRTLQELAVARPDAQTQHLLSSFYEERVRKGQDLDPATRLAYIRAGVSAADRALILSPDFFESMIIKNILLRHQANAETEPAARGVLLAEADQLRVRAIELQKARTLIAGNGSAAGTTGGGQVRAGDPGGRAASGVGTTAGAVAGQPPFRVGGNIKAPVKTRDVRAVYPAEAQFARITGMVMIEATIDESGAVREARVIRSVPGLDRAAVDAVLQWRFVPTLVDGIPVAVITTVTVNFSMQFR